MSTEKNYFELIEPYLEGSMAESDKIVFENQLSKDPLLNNEYILQKDIIHSIQEVRRTELKSRLDKINVSAGQGFNTMKVLTAAAVTALVGFGIYYLVNSNSGEGDNMAQADNTPVNVEELDTDTVDPITNVETDNDVATTTDLADEVVDVIDESVEDKVEPIVEEATTDNVKDVASEEIEITPPTIVEDKDEEISEVTENIDLDNVESNELADASAPDMEVKNIKDSKHEFHYQFYSSKLFLYGDFKGIPYEILELNSSEGVSVYMFYDNNFYIINQDQVEITALQKISDNNLIKKLNIIKDNN